MLVDLTVLAYHNAIRINGWVGNLAQHTEREAFGLEGLTVKLSEKYGHAMTGFEAEEHIERIRERLIPLVDQLNRTVRDNLKALHGSGASPSMKVEKADTVNVVLVHSI